MTMRFLCFFLIVWPIGSFCQEYQKDIKTKSQKEDSLNKYQSDLISKTDLLKALEMSGVGIFKFPLDSFDKPYKLSINLDEYVDSKKVDSTTIYSFDNTYIHYKNDSSDVKLYFDYIDQLVFFSKEIDSLCVLKIETYGSSIGGIKLKKNNARSNQSYNWRSYSKTKWGLNRNIPLLIYASSWYDKKYNFERFCGVIDLSKDEKGTRELLENSPHYYIISYEVSNSD